MKEVNIKANQAHYVTAASLDRISMHKVIKTVQMLA